VHAVSGSALDEFRRWLDTGGGVEQLLLLLGCAGVHAERCL